MINNYFEKLLIIENILFKYKMRVSQNKNSLNFNIVNINNICNKHINEL